LLDLREGKSSGFDHFEISLSGGRKREQGQEEQRG